VGVEHQPERPVIFFGKPQKLGHVFSVQSDVPTIAEMVHPDALSRIVGIRAQIPVKPFGRLQVPGFADTAIEIASTLQALLQDGNIICNGLKSR